jgi:peptidoglycan/xylan/chitin deacetylase (PgdA/CDA1 family)
MSTPSPPVSEPAPDLLAGPPHEIVKGPRDRPQVALTFHGAGEPASTRAVLGVFRRYGGQATVLAVGRWLDTYPELATEILGAGHELGNHTYTHPTLPDLGASAARDEIERCADVLSRVGGSRGRWFRPSGTPHATPLILRLAAEAGYPVCLSYDVDSLDYTDPGPGAVRSRVAAAVGPGSIVSLHLGHRGTVVALPGILTDLARRGLSAVTVSTLVGVR